MRIPPVYTGSDLNIAMREACVPILPGPCTKMWTYDGMFPGPTIRRPSGVTTRVTFSNELPSSVGSTTVHHHGNHSASRFDGQPAEHLIAPGQKDTYTYDFMEDGQPERAAFQWYHDHRMDVTGRNVWMGLAGMFVLDDKFDAKLGLPKGAYDVPLMVVDRTFDQNNQLNYKFNSIGDLGNQILVNGVPSPYFEVADRKYRFRILNASNFREYRFQLSEDMEMIQIATESGLLPQPLRRKSIVLGPAERAEVIIDFKGQLGRNITLSNTLDPIIDETPATVPREVMQFRVNRRNGKDNSRVPSELRPVPTTFGEPSETRVWVLGGSPGLGATRRKDEGNPPRNILWLINGQPFDHTRVDAQPKLNSTERWIFVNNTITLHRVHIHDVDWKIVSRSGTGVAVATPGDPDAALSEAGLRETFLVQSGETVEVISRFTDHLGK
ncbi:MAG TPA: multicopper oxidase domain-containing protein, partial [Pyrinomonadaceae bacterium]|nr:multicopper oxidase domain-containing protein [Pyrinomonadaceae bacterium]